MRVALQVPGSLGAQCLLVSVTVFARAEFKWGSHVAGERVAGAELSRNGLRWSASGKVEVSQL